MMDLDLVTSLLNCIAALFVLAPMAIGLFKKRGKGAHCALPLNNGAGNG
jgi:hypothetical protein